METRRPDLSSPGGPLLVHSRLRPPVARVPWVARPRLVDRLREGASRPLTVVSAPGGFGKTTLLAQWAGIDAPGTPFAWVTLAEDSKDATTFLWYVIEALRSIDPAIGRAARRRLGGFGDDPVGLAMPALLNDVEQLPQRVVLVLDEFDAVQEPETQHWMTYLLENLAGPLHIAVATRSVPPLPLGRLRAHGDLTELGANDLRFSQDEARALLGGHMELAVPDGELEGLVEATEGWAAGVYLAGLFLSDDPARTPDRFRGTLRPVADFLRDEVLHRQPEPVREFLLRTSVLDRMSPGLCDAVTGGDGAALMLADLERSNLFIVPLDEDAAWYRYHLLFRDMLRSEAARVMGPELPELHRRASGWHQANGTAIEAVRHAAEAGDDALTVELIKSNWVVWARSGHRATVWSWLDGLPWEVVRSDPHLCAIAAYLLTYAGEFDAAKVWLSRIPERVPPAASPLADGFSSVEAIRQVVLSHPVHSLAASLRAARGALELEPLGSAWRSAVEVAFGLNLYLDGQRAEARHQLERARAEASTAPRPGAQIMAIAYLSLIEHDVGDPAEADALALEARQLLDVHDIVDYPILAPLFVLSAAALARRGERERAELELAEANRLASAYGRSMVPALASLLAARLRLSWGDAAGCQAHLRDAHASLNACSDTGVLREEFAALDARTRSRAPRQDLPDALTASEIAVLRLLATDLSLGEVAARLFVSINTIKTHTRHIYQKLRAPSRRAAVERGRELGLI
ncbi:MAG TPA: LuxR C-terminal-related transcriptional regulator [Actinomycetota bacterium]|nr:LuxR C-terminal-related transcriptional regulator [Actinomycetota bacterium]